MLHNIWTLFVVKPKSI